jgi:hypothetical protein
MNHFSQKELIIAVVEKDGSILMRKKPAGSPPYQETWYSFGCERIPNQDDPKTLKNYLKTEIGIDVEVDNKQIPFGNEIKKGHDGVTKLFIYINLLCRYLDGAPIVPKGAEKVEWIPKEKLGKYDLVPPSVKLFKILGYIT